jgi:DNA polymerase-4
MEKLPIGVLAKRFGNPGRRIWYMCQGADPEPLQLNVPPPKSIGHGKVMPPNTRDRNVILTFLLHMSEKVAARLRRHTMVSKHFFIGLRGKHEWIAAKKRSELPTDDSRVIMSLCRGLVEEQWRGQGVFQVQVTALSPYSVSGQMEMFTEADNRRQTTNTAMDAVNERYGEFTLAPAKLVRRSDMPNVIAPSWKPFGHRQTIQDEAADRDRSRNTG